MENNILTLEGNKKQSLEAWVNETILPILEIIGVVSEYLEGLLKELN